MITDYNKYLHNDLSISTCPTRWLEKKLTDKRDNSARSTSSILLHINSIQYAFYTQYEHIVRI